MPFGIPNVEKHDTIFIDSPSTGESDRMPFTTKVKIMGSLALVVVVLMEYD